MEPPAERAAAGSSSYTGQTDPTPKSDSEIVSDIEEDWETTETLPNKCGRVEKVLAVDEQLTIVFEANAGSVHESSDVVTRDRRLDFALPSESSKPWVRLCEYLDVDPAKPTELKGEMIPIRREGSSDLPYIEIPPIQQGLNPYVYKYRRFKSRRLYSSNYTAFDSEPHLASGLIATLWLLFSISPLIWTANHIPTEGLALGDGVIWFVVVSNFSLAFTFTVLKMLFWVSLSESIAQMKHRIKTKLKSIKPTIRSRLFPKP